MGIGGRVAAARGRRGAELLIFRTPVAPVRVNAPTGAFRYSAQLITVGRALATTECTAGGTIAAGGIRELAGRSDMVVASGENTRAGFTAGLCRSGCRIGSVSRFPDGFETCLMAHQPRRSRIHRLVLGILSMSQFPAQSGWHESPESAPFAVQFHLLGTVPFEDFLVLQQRLVFEAGGHDDGRITVLLCEHPTLISIGRGGSRGHIRLTNEQLRLRQLPVRWVSRGGGCVLHGPGQIAVYPIVPLAWHGWTVGQYVNRLRVALTGMLEDLGVHREGPDAPGGIWGRSGQLVSWGLAVRHWITCHGAHVNVNPPMTHYPFVDVVDPLKIDSGKKSTMGCLLAERRQSMLVPRVRAAFIPRFAAALGTERYYLMTGHPLLVESRRAQDESQYRAS